MFESTGPTSSAGKRKVSRNARKHGLAVPIGSIPKLDGAAERLAHIIAGGDPPLARIEVARRVAEAQIDLVRIRQVKFDLLNDLRSEPEDPNICKLIDLAELLFADQSPTNRDRQFRNKINKINEINILLRRCSDPAGRAAADSVDISQQLVRIDRYERRAHSRRKQAIRDLNALIQ